MELYLDSADINEIKDAFQLGFLAGLTTTPTFMHRHGITDIDKTIIELSKIVPVLQIEALGETAEEIVDEAERQNDLGLDKKKTVYKIPISLEGVKACKILKDKGYLVNVHLIYTLQQAYMALEAGATYVCPLIGRLQDQGTDALLMLEQIISTTNYYNYDTKIMFSSVRYPEHIRNALNIGVHTITAPWKVIKMLTENHFTTVGTEQFFEHTRLMTLKVKEALENKNPTVTTDANVAECLVKLTSDGFGAVAIVDKNQKPVGIFTDGDLRRLVTQSNGKDVSQIKIADLPVNAPQCIDANALLIDAQNIFSSKKIDQLVVTENGKVIGMLDIQNLVK